MKKFLNFTAAIVLAMFTAMWCGCIAEGGEETGNVEAGNVAEHTHTFDTEWSHDVEYHWHASTCGHGDAEVKEPHSFRGTERAASCAEEGGTIYECVCGYSYAENSVPALGHEISIEKVEPECTEAGKIVYSCAGCDYTRTVVLPARHKYNQSKNSAQLSCAVCGDTLPASAGLNFAEVWEDPFSFFDKGELLGYKVDSSPEVSGEIVIPYYFEGKEVIGIDSFAFQNCGGLTSAEIPSSVKTIGMQAFEASGLSRVVIPESVEEIWTFAFRKCASLKDVSFCGVVGTISAWAFGETAFYNEAGNWDKGALYADGHLLDGGKTENEYTVKPDTFTIADRAFEDNEKLQKINFPRSLESIGEMAFSGCSGLASAILPEKIKCLQSKCFYGCSSLKSLYLPKAVELIYSGALGGCSSLETITYGGTSADWENVLKAVSEEGGAFNWNNNTGNYTLVCTDKSIPKKS